MVEKFGKSSAKSFADSKTKLLETSESEFAHDSPTLLSKVTAKAEGKKVGALKLSSSRPTIKKEAGGSKVQSINKEKGRKQVTKPKSALDEEGDIS